MFPLSFALNQNIRGSRWREEQSKAKVMCRKLMGNVQFVYFRKRIEEESISSLFYFCLLTDFGLFFSLLLLFIIVLLFFFVTLVQ